MKTIIINQDNGGRRLDSFLFKLFPNIKKSEIYKFIRNKKIKINGQKKEFSYRLQNNDCITIFFNYVQTNNEKPWLNINKKINLVYEDDNIIVVDKPAKLESVSQEGKIDTLINRVKKYLYNSHKWHYSNEDCFEPCLIHRLDTNTSGLIIACKNRQSADILNNKIKNHEISKYYHCSVYGKMPKTSDTIAAYLCKQKNKNMVDISTYKKNNNYKEIHTFYKVIRYDQKSDISYLDIKLITGRTHQIRAHMNFINHSLVGEQKYIKKCFILQNKKMKHQDLRCYKIIFNFNNNSGILNYLKNKQIEIN